MERGPPRAECFEFGRVGLQSDYLVPNEGEARRNDGSDVAVADHADGWDIVCSRHIRLMSGALSEVAIGSPTWWPIDCFSLVRTSLHGVKDK